MTSFRHWIILVSPIKSLESFPNPKITTNTAIRVQLLPNFKPIDILGHFWVHARMNKVHSKI